MKNTSRLCGYGALLVAIGIGLGAFGAHALKDVVAPDKLVVFEKAVFYHLIHGLALTFLPVLAGLCPLRAKEIIAGFWALLCGVIVFSGSLYCYVIFNVREAVFITPCGGLTLIIAWLYVAVQLIRHESR